VLSDRPDSRYADQPDRHYDFPPPHDKPTASYLRIVRTALDGVLAFYWTEEASGPLTGFAVARPVGLVLHREIPS